LSQFLDSADHYFWSVRAFFAPHINRRLRTDSSNYLFCWILGF